MSEPRDWLRRAGRGRDTEGWWVIWSVAEGKRGRRWREVRRRDIVVASSLLLETGPDGRFSHLDLSTSAGLMTLHPETDGTLHGNVIGPEGVEHVRGRAWDADGIVLLEGSTICKVAAADLLQRWIQVWSSASVPSVTIGPQTLWLDDFVPTRVERLSASQWRFGRGEPLRVDERGLPLLEEGEIWPLEE
jgi:hypothetical protein